MISELSDNDEDTIFADLKFITEQINQSCKINSLCPNQNKLAKSSSTPILHSKYLHEEKELDNAIYLHSEGLSQSELDESKIENSNFAINLTPGTKNLEKILNLFLVSNDF